VGAAAADTIPIVRLFLLLALPLLAQSPAERLNALYADHWEFTLRESPVSASSNGDRRYNSQWPDLSAPAQQRRQQQIANFLQRLAAIPQDSLDPAAQLNVQLFQKQLQRTQESYRRQQHLIALNTYSGIHYQNRSVDSIPLETAKDYQDWITRLQTFGTYMDQTIALLRDGIRARLVQPKGITEKLIRAVELQLVDAPEKSGFYKPFTRFPASIAEPERARLAGQGRQAIRDHVLPAYQRLLTFLNQDYLAASYPEPGIWQAPNGKQLYAWLAEGFTTTSMTPEQIHETGLREVARIKDEMHSVMKQTGFTGTLPEFFQFLRTDPRFYYASGSDLLDAYRALSKRIDGELLKVFHLRTMPRTPYGVQPIPDNLAPFTTTAYYGPPALDGSRSGTYWVNLHQVNTRPKYEMAALTLHEAVPGHHLQIAAQQELGELPRFRQSAGYTAYVEGWALYAEGLGEQMGLYQDPYARMGRLTYDMWRAVRLVVDTGLHYYGWPRERAIQFFRDNAPKSEADIQQEIDRYISWPGQATAYKIGELKIRALRQKAEQTLGSKFSLKDFHHQILRSGAVPLDVLEREFEAWLRNP
jgi:uncharacterized protein (DUF885 family)